MSQLKICEYCGYIITDGDLINMRNIIHKLQDENDALKDEIVFLEKQLSEKPTKKMKIGPAQEG